MNIEELQKRYAELVVRLGANVAPGQIVGIMCHVEHVGFARAITEECYRVGAKFVDVWYWDAHLKRSRVSHAPEDTLSWTPPWLDLRYEELTRRKGASIVIAGDPAPNLLAGIDPRRAGLDRMPRIPSRLKMVHSEEVNWTIVPFPTEAWSSSVYGEPDIERLWRDTASFLRLDTPDPVAAWKDHLAMLKTRATQLTDRSFDAIRFVGPGTDLKVGLLPGHRWLAAGFKTRWGREHLPNMPTEEVFTTPDFSRTEGVVSSTRPLALQGNVIEDLVMEFKEGVAVRVDASAGADVVRGQHAVDPGAARLGEVALVDKSSKVGATGITYLETLLDENATSHIAYGAGYPHAIPGAENLPEEEWEGHGINPSGVHTDFMIGGSEVQISGIDKDGDEVPIITDDTWRLEN